MRGNTCTWSHRATRTTRDTHPKPAPARLTHPPPRAPCALRPPEQEPSRPSPYRPARPTKAAWTTTPGMPPDVRGGSREAPSRICNPSRRADEGRGTCRELWSRWAARRILGAVVPLGCAAHSGSGGPGGVARRRAPESGAPAAAPGSVARRAVEVGPRGVPPGSSPEAASACGGSRDVCGTGRGREGRADCQPRVQDRRVACGTDGRNVALTGQMWGPPKGRGAGTGRRAALSLEAELLRWTQPGCGFSATGGAAGRPGQVCRPRGGRPSARVRGRGRPRACACLRGSLRGGRAEPATPRSAVRGRGALRARRLRAAPLRRAHPDVMGL